MAPLILEPNTHHLTHSYHTMGKKHHSCLQMTQKYIEVSEGAMRTVVG